MGVRLLRYDSRVGRNLVVFKRESIQLVLTLKEEIPFTSPQS
jgi:hypothetical protein